MDEEQKQPTMILPAFSFVGAKKGWGLTTCPRCGHLCYIPNRYRSSHAEYVCCLSCAGRQSPRKKEGT